MSIVEVKRISDFACASLNPLHICWQVLTIDVNIYVTYFLDIPEVGVWLRCDVWLKIY